MTAPDVRTAAQEEASCHILVSSPDALHIISEKRSTAELLVDMFTEGAVWGAALVTPTREQIAEALRCHNLDELLFGNVEWDGFTAACACGWRSDEFKMPGDAHQAHSGHAADAVLALMQELAEGRGP